MDAHNNAEPDQTRPAGASPDPQSRPKHDAEPPRAVSAVSPNSPGKSEKRRDGSGEASEDRDSDAETIVLPGKDGHSPSKARKVRQEDKSDGDADNSKDAEKGVSGTAHDPVNDSTKDKAPATKSRTSPSLSRRRRRSVSTATSQSDAEGNSTKTSLREKIKSGERLLPQKRRAPKPDSDSDDGDSTQRVRRKRTTSVSMDNGRLSRERRSSLSRSHGTRNQSTSPHRSHRRSASTQLSTAGPSNKKRRIPAPLHQTDYHSDESSTSGSPHPRASKTRPTPVSATGESNASPAKVPSHKKHLDAHGQTLLARACARGEFDVAKKRLADRKEDLNVADYAGNTPLQIAAINGCEDIVQLLINAGCNLDCVNYDKDTPLLDAVDNGHLGVVKLLLDAGVNPRKANVNGEEPIDRVTDETDNAEEIRAALIEAKSRFGGRTKTSEDRNSHVDSHDNPDSPRNSPAATPALQPAGRRSGTVRATKTRNDLLYQPLDDRTLRQAAGRGDEEMVARILQVKGNCTDAEPMVAAARGGHDLVIQLLLGLGSADPDPEPVASQPAEFATPILAAIGQENIKVLELLLEQQSVDPTRRFKGETYYEIAKRRQGTNWREEEQILKNAYDAYKSSQKPKTKSPGRRDRDKEREEKRLKRETSGDGRPHKRDPRSPSRDSEVRKKMPTKMPSPKEKRRSDSQSRRSDDKRGITRSKRDEKAASATNTSDREASPAMAHKNPKTKRTDSEVAVSSEGETSKPRRKLVSKGELRGERDKRRSSVTSATSAPKEPASPRDSRPEGTSEKERALGKQDRAKALKKEESRDATDSSTKRQRTSLASERSHNGDNEEGDVPVKRRRIDGEETGNRQKQPPSPEHGRSRKASSSTEVPAAGSATKTSEKKDSVRIKSEDADVEMPDADREDVPVATADDGSETQKKKKTKKDEDREGTGASQADTVAVEAKDEEKELAKKRRKEELEAAEREREAENKKREEAERLKQEEEERKRLAEAKARQEEEERIRKQQEEKRRLEEEKRLREEEEERKRRQAEEEERLRKEREAAEEARRKREEEERKERERRERAHREEMERKRAAREAEQRRIREEQEKARLEKLPPLLQWLDICPNPKQAEYAKIFRSFQGVRYDTIDPSTSGTPKGREQWVINTHVALLLGEKDLNLTRYTDWERVPASHLAKVTIWRLDKRLYCLLPADTWALGRQVPGYYHGGENCKSIPLEISLNLQYVNMEKFCKMDLFFIKLSDLLYTVSSVPHLRDIRLGVLYREVIEDEFKWEGPKKWKQDPDANKFGGFFAPKKKYYVNGEFVGEDKPTFSETSPTPFPEKRVPRRGLLQVFPSDPDYVRYCLEQGLEHLVPGHKIEGSLPNGTHTAEPSDAAGTPPRKDPGPSGVAPVHGTTNGAGVMANGGLPNGINGPSAS